MPETIDAPPVEAAPDAGMSRFMSDVMTDVEAPVAPPTQPKTDEPPPDPPKKTAKEVAEPEDKTKQPEVKPKVDVKAKPPEKAKPEDNGTLRKRLEETVAETRAKQAEMEKLSGRIKELESKRVYSDDDDAKVKKYEARIAELETGISEVAYERSPEFKAKFMEPWQNTFDAAVRFTEALKVAVDDNGTMRQATRNDFLRIAGLPPDEQAAAAQQMFGPNALRIISQIDRLQEIKSQSDIALKTHREGMGEKQKQTEESRAKEAKIYDDTRATAIAELKREFPQFFDADPDDPDATAQLEAGYAYVDNATENMVNMPVADRAAYAAVLRARAAHFPRAVHKIKTLEAALEAAQAENKKLRGTDPGNADDKGGEAPKKEEVPTGGIAAMTDERIWSE